MICSTSGRVKMRWLPRCRSEKPSQRRSEQSPFEGDGRIRRPTQDLEQELLVLSHPGYLPTEQTPRHATAVGDPDGIRFQRRRLRTRRSATEMAASAATVVGARITAEMSRSKAACMSSCGGAERVGVRAAGLADALPETSRPRSPPI